MLPDELRIGRQALSGLEVESLKKLPSGVQLLYEAGVAPLQWDSSLGSAAAAYAQQMAMTGLFAHSNRAQRSRQS